MLPRPKAIGRSKDLPTVFWFFPLLLRRRSKGKNQKAKAFLSRLRLSLFFQIIPRSLFLLPKKTNWEIFRPPNWFLVPKKQKHPFREKLKDKSLFELLPFFPPKVSPRISLSLCSFKKTIGRSLDLPMVFSLFPEKTFFPALSFSRKKAKASPFFFQKSKSIDLLLLFF